MLKGERVLLRAFNRDDLARKAEFANDPEYFILLNDDPWEPVLLEGIQGTLRAAAGGQWRRRDVRH